MFKLRTSLIGSTPGGRLNQTEGRHFTKPRSLKTDICAVGGGGARRGCDEGYGGGFSVRVQGCS